MVYGEALHQNANQKIKPINPVELKKIIQDTEAELIRLKKLYFNKTEIWIPTTPCSVNGVLRY